MYVKVDQEDELDAIKELGLQAWSGRHQKYLNVTAGGNVIRYYFSSQREYTRFIRELRKLENEGE